MRRHRTDPQVVRELLDAPQFVDIKNINHITISVGLACAAIDQNIGSACVIKCGFLRLARHGQGIRQGRDPYVLFKLHEDLPLQFRSTGQKSPLPTSIRKRCDDHFNRIPVPGIRGIRHVLHGQAMLMPADSIVNRHELFSSPQMAPVSLYISSSDMPFSKPSRT